MNYARCNHCGQLSEPPEVLCGKCQEVMDLEALARQLKTAIASGGDDGDILAVLERAEALIPEVRRTRSDLIWKQIELNELVVLCDIYHEHYHDRQRVDFLEKVYFCTGQMREVGFDPEDGRTFREVIDAKKDE